MSSDLWRNSERLLAPRRTQALVLLGLLVGFVLFRWAQRLEPWNTDDMTLFQFSEDAVSGHHWLFGWLGEIGTSGHPAIPHLAFRLGLLPFSVPIIKALGAHAMAYYLVPLLFALLGFGALYWLMFTQFGPVVALVFAVIHLAWPFELAHSSVFLSDLPSAAAALLCLCLLHTAGQQTGRRRSATALLAGLAALECQLSRNNAIVLLAPALLLFLWSRPTRLPTLWAGAVVLLGMLANQLLLVYRGLGWGYDWSSVRADFADYAPFLSVYSWREFLLRQFRYQVTSFGFGISGGLAAVLTLASLVGHVLLLRFERRVLLVGVAAFGLFTWLVYSFSIYELVPGGVRAMSPCNFRFIQPFTYSSLVVWAWAWAALRNGSALPRWASAALPLLLVSFSYFTSSLHLPQIYREGGTRRLVRAVEDYAAASKEPLLITGTNLRVPRRFCCSDVTQPVEWRELSATELGQVVASKSGALVLRDIPRDLKSARYLAPEARQAYGAELARLEETLWNDYELEYVDARYALFAAPHAHAAASADIVRTAASVPTAPAGTPLLDEAACRLATDPLPGAAPPETADTWRTLLPIQAGPGRALCEYTWPEDGLALAAASGADRGAGSGFVLRLNADYESPLGLAVDVVEQGAHGLRRRQVEILPGTSYVPVPSHADTRNIFLVYRLRTRGASAQQVVRVQPIQWRSHQFRTDGGGAVEAAAADGS